ncbi:MAG: S-layer homology domain-containing protein [Eubacteriales bacterium]
MLNKKTVAAILSLALAGSMTVPAVAVDASNHQLTPDVKSVISGYTPVISDYTPVIATQNPLTRAELVTVLYEKEGKPSVNFAMDYADVAADAEYAEAVRWASSQGIVSGYGNGNFGPDDSVTREQLAVILYRYAQSNDQGFTGNWAFPLGYSDANEISEFAYEAVCWMTMKDIMGPAEENLFAPKAEVTLEAANQVFEQYFNIMETVEIPNPFISCQTMDDAAQIAGFSMTLPSSVPNWVNTSKIRAVQSNMIEVIYQGNQNQLTIRKAVGTEDISGDFTTYSDVHTEDVNNHCVTVKGNDGKIMVATWTDGNYTYSIQTAAGLEHDALVSIVSSVQ